MKVHTLTCQNTRGGWLLLLSFKTASSARSCNVITSYLQYGVQAATPLQCHFAVSVEHLSMSRKVCLVTNMLEVKRPCSRLFVDGA